MASPEKLAAKFGLQGDTSLISLANDIYHGCKPMIPGNISTGLPYAALEMAYVHLGRPALKPHKPAFQSSSGLSDSNYQQLLEKLLMIIRNQEMRSRMSNDIPHTINSIHTSLKGLGIAELEPTISAVEGELLKKMNIASGECGILPIAVILSCLSVNPQIYGKRSSFLELEYVAKTFLIKKMTLQEKIKDVQVKCEATLKGLKEDKAFQSALSFALEKLTAKPKKVVDAPKVIGHLLSVGEAEIELEVERFGEQSNEPLQKRSRKSASFNVNILEGYGEFWGPRGICSVLPLESTNLWQQYEQLEKQYLQQQQRLQAARPHTTLL